MTLCRRLLRTPVSLAGLVGMATTQTGWSAGRVGQVWCVERQPLLTGHLEMTLYMAGKTQTLTLVQLVSVHFLFYVKCPDSKHRPETKSKCCVRMLPYNNS